MKNIKSILVAVTAIFTVIFTANSCVKDGDWDNNSDNSAFGFTVERDTDFPEKAVGDTIEFKANIKTNYDFASVPMTFKSNVDPNRGTLRLNGIIVEPNKEYSLANSENIFDYTGTAAGTHAFSITFTNSKGVSKAEDFQFTYAVSDFTVSVTDPTSDIYQSQDGVYNLKITPSKSNQISGYQIRFDSYPGTIKYDAAQAQLGQWYPINNISAFTITLNSNVAGTNTLKYSIKNATITQDNLTINQEIKQRQIIVESMALSPTTGIKPGDNLQFNGVIKKDPPTNSQIYYKTRVVSASTDLDGLQTTDNQYVSTQLGANGNFGLNFKAVKAGDYTLAIQFKDEFNNETAEQTFNISVVDETLQFVGTAAGTLTFIKTSFPYYIYVYGLQAFNVSFSAKSGGNNKIIKIKYLVSYTRYGSSSATIEPEVSEDVSATNEVNYTNKSFSLVGSQFNGTASVNSSVSNPKIKITLITNQGEQISQEITPSLSTN